MNDYSVDSVLLAGVVFVTILSSLVLALSTLVPIASTLVPIVVTPVSTEV